MQLLSIGYARVDLTPEESVALCGYGDDAQRISEGVLDPITGTCLAMTDEQADTILLYTLDLLAAYAPCNGGHQGCCVQSN